MGAAGYELVVAGADGVISLDLYDAGLVCSSSACLVQPTLTLPPHAVYAWWVRAFDASGAGPWSAGSLFDVNVITGPPANIPAAADTVGLYEATGNYFALLPLDIESSEDLRFHTVASVSAFLFSPDIYPTAVHGNFDGAGGDTVGLYDPRAHRFYLRSDNSPRAEAELSFDFGSGTPAMFGPNPIAIAGHWKKGQNDTVGLFDPASATFELAGTNAAGPAENTFSFGTPGTSRPITGDWIGSGVDTVGTYESATGLFRLRNENDAGPADFLFPFGPIDPGNAVPVAGDWDGDGIDTVGVFDVSSYQLFLRNANATGPADWVIQLERTTWPWQPLAGKWRSTNAPPESPGYDWPTALPESVSIDRAQLDKAFSDAQNLPFSKSLLVIRRGFLVREAYFHGDRPERAENLASASKSILSALFGVAAADGGVNLAQPISQVLSPSYYPAAADPHRDVDLGELMTMTSGFESTDDFSADQWNQLVALSDDWVGTILANPSVADAGTQYVYSTMNNVVGAHILANQVGDLYAYAQQNLLDPLGIKILWWNRDPQGVNAGGGDIGMKARDMARFGYLFLNGGLVGGKQLLPQEWVAVSTAPLVPVPPPSSRFGQFYGLWWWHALGEGDPHGDIYAAKGYGGQYIYVLPREEAVIVMTNGLEASGDALTLQYDLLDALFWGDLLPAFH